MRPSCQRLDHGLETHQVERCRVVAALWSQVDFHVLELEDHVEFAVGGVGVAPGVVDAHSGHLADGEERHLSARPGLAMHLGEELVEARAVREAIGVGTGELFGDQVDDVEAEAVDPAVEPPTQHGIDGSRTCGLSQFRSACLRSKRWR